MEIKESEEKIRLKGQLRDINIQIEKIRRSGAKIPDALLNIRSQVEAKVKKNKFNAKKSSWNGIEFDSTFEMEYAQLLDKCGISFSHHIQIELVPAFELKYETGLTEFNSKIRAITYEPDFIIADKIIIDVKGNKATQTRTFEDKWKLLKSIYGAKYVYLVISNRQEAASSITTIKKVLTQLNKEK